jgi:formylglycine-generating enzyme required for sulfatase activity
MASVFVFVKPFNNRQTMQPPQMVTIPQPPENIYSLLHPDTKHKIAFIKPFQMQKFLVTQKEWSAVMGKNPSKFKGGNLPVKSITHDEAVEYAKKLSQLLNLPQDKAFRLPTEWEWEWSALGGGPWEDRLASLDEAWVNKNSKGKTHEVGLLKPNGYGLHDILGNVWEWTSSEYSSDNNKVIRGGSWGCRLIDARIAFRSSCSPSYHASFLGFRLCKNI